MATTSERTVVEIRGVVIDIRSSQTQPASCVYIELGDKTFYLDDSTGEAIMKWWPTSATEAGDLDSIDLDHDLGTRDLTSPFGEEE